jgi:hypothetical protein
MNIYNRNYLLDPTLEYISIASEFSKMNMFRSAVQNSDFGEEKFKSELYLCSKNTQIYLQALIELYALFGVLTIELVDMLKWTKRYSGENI